MKRNQKRENNKMKSLPRDWQIIKNEKWNNISSILKGVKSKNIKIPDAKKY